MAPVYDKFVCVDDWAQNARKTWTTNTKSYYESGADSEETLALNLTSFKQWRIRPRILRDVSKIDTKTSILGYPISMPICIAPSAMQRLCHDEGELATSRAAARSKTCMVLSTYSTRSLESVAAASEDILPSALKFFQLYVYKDRRISETLIRRAEASGYKAIVLTVDSPLLGRRLSDLRVKFNLPPEYTLESFDGININPAEGTQTWTQVLSSTSDTTLNWETDIDWIKSITKLPIVIKGILTAEDALLAAHHGISAVYVSNHGGRQLDSTPSAMEVLPEIVQALKGSNVEVYVDGGVRKGSDAFKCLALGARAVFIGRPVLYGLSAGGEDSLVALINILRTELELTMALAGTRNISEITPALVRHERDFIPRL
ncbi:hypothetical protein SmJEL517_g04603 [Synchytrium microbalum]|uniref:Oxidase FUB9 n=1 Tax=Synchytrium microbalum TaxID=1806994 RepID=A0A507C2U1_9FUNG|nr:uncharacterized protein SmJEL517_g04603 [Synchytrium microbalum]TPX32266.1 hypothetical protein SmJEL517_g04603 [Synchytrium microbalum]